MFKIFAKISKFFKEVKEETKKINWPTKQEVQSSAVLILIVLIIFTLYIFVVDLILSQLVKIILG